MPPYSALRRFQGLHKKRYWLRAVNKVIEDDELRDQVVAKDFRQWCDDPNQNVNLIKGICSTNYDPDVWMDFASRFLREDRNKILLLSEQVIRQIRHLHGAKASLRSQGFSCVLEYAWRMPADERLYQWFQYQIHEAASVSIELINGLWCFYGDHENSLVPATKRPELRKFTMGCLKTSLVTGEALERVLDPDRDDSLHDLVGSLNKNILAYGDEIPDDVLEEWQWLGAPILDALRRRSKVVALNVESLLYVEESDLKIGGVWPVNRKMFDLLFADDGEQAIRLLEELRDSERISSLRRLSVASVIEILENRGET